MYRLPSGPTATPTGVFRLAAVAGPPSPQGAVALAHVCPVPATVVMTPSAPTRRIRSLPASAMYRLPSGPSATPLGKISVAAVAGPPSPLDPWVPVPATVVRTPSA